MIAPVVVVTGGIGSGKSLAVKMLVELYPSAVAYDADSRAKELYHSVPGLLDSIESALGCSFRTDGCFDASLLANRIFTDRDALAEVENLLFPALKADFETFASQASSQGAPFVIFESATVLEKEQFSDFGDIVLLVDAPMEQRIARSCERDGVSREKILSRMDNQKLMNAFSQGTLTKFAKDPLLGRAASRVDEVILNDSTPEELKAKLAGAIRRTIETR